jgi:hypothetical protein
MALIDIPDWKWTLYRWFANDLLDVVQGLRNEIAGKNGLILDMNEDIKRLKQDIQKAKIDSDIAVRVIRERMSSGESCLNDSIISARHHAAQDRIKSLEKDNIFLVNEVYRLKAKLAKFNQK